MTDWDEINDGIAEIMSETPVGDNHGLSLTSIPASHGVTGSLGDGSAGIVFARTSPTAPKRTLNSKDHEAKNATQGITSDEREYHYLGMTAHRGVLHPDEYVDLEALVFALEMRLGFSIERVQFLYSKPNPSTKDIPDKMRLEDLFLELDEAGGNMKLLATLLGLTVRADGTCFPMSRGIARARERRGY